MKEKTNTPDLLSKLLEARSPSGFEFEAQAVLDKQLQPIADDYQKDVLGNRIAILNPKGDPTLMLAGHMDELGLLVKYIDDNGFIYFKTIGGHDNILISGRRVTILTQKGPVSGVTGKRAVHLLSSQDRKKVPELHEMWIDIGTKEAHSLVSIGDPIIYDQGLQLLQNGRAVARGFDNKAGCYVVCEVFKRIAKKKSSLKAKLVTVATTQEEIGIRGATPASFTVNPHIGIAVDVTHATDHPDCDNKKFGKILLGKGPAICVGPNIHPVIFKKLVDLAKKHKIPHQLEADSGPTPTDARIIQMTRQGVATGLISIPLRYMHTPSEVVDLNDIENAVKLLEVFTLSLKNKEYIHW